MMVVSVDPLLKLSGVGLPFDAVERIVAARSKFYHLPERETVRTPAKLPKETHITFARVVERAGYRFQADDLDEMMLRTLCVQAVADTTGMTIDQVRVVLKVLDLYSPFRRVKYNLIPYLLEQLKQKASTGDCELRTLWYRETDEPDGVESGIIEGRCAKWIGERYPGHGSMGTSSPWGYGDVDYVPPCLGAAPGAPRGKGATYQELYMVRTWYHPGILVHPLDVVEEG